MYLKYKPSNNFCPECMNIIICIYHEIYIYIYIYIYDRYITRRGHANPQGITMIVWPLIAVFLL